MNTTIAIRRLAALAQDSRLKVFRLLVQAGPEGRCVGDIQSRTRIAPATLSFHLKELAHAGLIEARQDGRFIYYAPNLKAMDRLIGYLTDNCCGGAPCAVAGTRTPRRAA